MAFIVLKSSRIDEQHNTGEALIKVAETVFDDTPESEWKRFDADIKGWLFDHGYRYTTNPDGDFEETEENDGRIPATIEIVPVYDTPTRMHVRIPWAADLKNPPEPRREIYTTDFPAFLARYFMRKCR